MIPSRHVPGTKKKLGYLRYELSMKFDLKSRAHHEVNCCYLSLLLFCSQGANAGLAQDILDALQNAVTCTGCHALLIPLKTLAISGDSTFTKTLSAICKATGVNLSCLDILFPPLIILHHC